MGGTQKKYLGQRQSTNSSTPRTNTPINRSTAKYGLLCLLKFRYPHHFVSSYLWFQGSHDGNISSQSLIVSLATSTSVNILQHVLSLMLSF